MAATEDLRIPVSPITTILPIAPAVPSPDEAENRYYGLPSQPYFIARSSFDPWITPTGMDAYSQPRELQPIGTHPVCDILLQGGYAEIHQVLRNHEVDYTSVDPVRLGPVGEPAPPILWIGVMPGLSSEDGIEVALAVRAILIAKQITDVHIEIRVSITSLSASMLKPAFTSNPTVDVREAFATTLGIPICAAETPDIQGTATLFFTDTNKPGKLFLLTARHVVFPVNKGNEHYEFKGKGPRKNVLLLSKSGFEDWVEGVETKLRGVQIRLKHLERRLALAREMEDDDDARREEKEASSEIDQLKDAVPQLEQFLLDIKKNWSDPDNRVIGHIVLSPAFTLLTGADQFPQDFAVIEVDTTKINASNFIGNTIDLGIETSVGIFTRWMCPAISNQPSFEYPGDRLVRFSEILPIQNMRDHDSRNKADWGFPTIMVLKRGAASGLTVGCINTIASILRKPFVDSDSEYSMEVAVFPRSSTSGPFSKPGDSGAAIISGKGAIAGMMTGGSRGPKRRLPKGEDDDFDCTYVTPMHFLRDRLKLFGYHPNFFPVAADIFG